MERERLGRCQATEELGGRRTTEDRGPGTEHDRAWLIGKGCSDVAVEVLTSGSGFKSSMVEGRRGIAGLGLTSAALTSDWEGTALSGTCGAPFRAKLALAGLRYGDESGFKISLPA